ncbi:hypothetical protein [Streptomyces thermolilacinus]|uniref:hypothetical protein n=1 Tax=Streptomyces thermolilacinus TaxID=285540 RepID=UPI0033FA1426
MTLRVYSVRADGTTTTVREQQEIEPVPEIPATLSYPPCTCPRCETAAAEHEGAR